MTRDEFARLLSSRVLVGDGAMGTMLAEYAGATVVPERAVLEAPELVSRVHSEYAACGADWLQTCTFGANALKLADYGLADRHDEINRRAVRLATAASLGQLIVGTIGPTGRLPMLDGTSIDELYQAYRQQAQTLVAEGVDCLLVETMSCLLEAKAAIIAARDVSDCPLICSLTYEASGRTTMGNDPATAAAVLAAMPIDAIGVNCSVGPEQAIALVKELYTNCSLPILVQPNAGLPQLADGRTEYRTSPGQFAEAAARLVDEGAVIVGGRCGTRPEHITQVAQAVRGRAPRPRTALQRTVLASTTQTLIIGDDQPLPIIGERINPTARRQLVQAMQAGAWDRIKAEAKRQVEQGAVAIDINVGCALPGTSEAALMAQAVRAASQAVPVPLVLDSSDPDALEAGARVYGGKVLLNSTTASERQLECVLELARRYGAAVVGLTMDERGIPDTPRECLRLAERIVSAAAERGIAAEDVFIDVLTLTAAADGGAAMKTLEAIRLVKRELGVNTVLGVSNVSHGLPGRSSLTAAFLAMAIGVGLDVPICNPGDAEIIQAIRAADVLTGRDRHCRRWVSSQAPEESPAPAQASLVQRLRAAIIDGHAEQASELVGQLLEQGHAAMGLVDDVIVPALEELGSGYERGTVFLPGLLLGAEAAQAALGAIGQTLSTSESDRGPVVVLATVQGDIHDFGKNIVGALLKNHGFTVVDLGKDVPPGRIADEALASGAAIVGLSALMTTTMTEMPGVIRVLRERGSTAPVMVGGAVVTTEYAQEIGAHYAADAAAAVRLARSLVGKRAKQLQQLKDQLASGRFVITVELDPPKGTNLDSVMSYARELLGWVDAVNIADSPMATMRMSPIAIAHVLKYRVGIDTIFHLTCRDRNVIGLQSELLGAAALGVQNILVLTGDPPERGDHPWATGVFEVDSVGLVELAHTLTQGTDAAKRKLNEAPELFIGVAANPLAADSDREVDKLLQKIDKGARFVQTQPVYEVEALGRFIDRLGRVDVPIIGGILPLKSYRMTRHVIDNVPGITVPDWVERRMSAGGREAGLDIAAAVLRDMRAVADGAHLMPVGDARMVVDILQRERELDRARIMV